MEHRDVQLIIDELRGTCQSIESLYPEALDDPEFCAALDEELFLCEECEWWCERSEESEEREGYCEDCVPRT